MQPYGFIYLVRNKVNGKVYIGQTIQTVEVRWARHKYDALRGSTTPFHIAIRKYGADAFTVETFLIATDLADLNKKEIDTIVRFSSMDRKHGYNRRARGDSPGPWSDGTRAKVSAARAMSPDPVRLALESQPWHIKKQQRKELCRAASLKWWNDLPDEQREAIREERSRLGKERWNQVLLSGKTRFGE